MCGGRRESEPRFGRTNHPLTRPSLHLRSAESEALSSLGSDDDDEEEDKEESGREEGELREMRSEKRLLQGRAAGLVIANTESQKRQAGRK
jgi:hypothetical protein